MVTQTFEQNISYSMDSVKNSLKFLIDNYKANFLNPSENKVFNSFSFSWVKCVFNVYLSQIDDNTTNIKVECTPTLTGSQSWDEENNGKTMIYIKEFLEILSKKLEGKDDEVSKLVSNTDDSLGCFISGLSLIGSIIILFICFGLL